MPIDRRAASLTLLLCWACAPGCARLPADVVPRAGGGGRYLCPYLADGTVAPWAERGLTRQRRRDLPGFVTGIDAIDAERDQAYGARASGGWTYMKTTSGQSFDRLDDFVAYMHLRRHWDRWERVQSLAEEIYPDYRHRFWDMVLLNRMPKARPDVRSDGGEGSHPYLHAPVSPPGDPTVFTSRQYGGSHRAAVCFFKPVLR